MCINVASPEQIPAADSLRVCAYVPKRYLLCYDNVSDNILLTFSRKVLFAFIERYLGTLLYNLIITLR